MNRKHKDILQKMLLTDNKGTSGWFDDFTRDASEPF